MNTVPSEYTTRTFIVAPTVVGTTMVVDEVHAMQLITANINYVADANVGARVPVLQCVYGGFGLWAAPYPNGPIALANQLLSWVFEGQTNAVVGGGSMMGIGQLIVPPSALLWFNVNAFAGVGDLVFGLRCVFRRVPFTAY